MFWPFIIAILSTAFFSIFAWLATRYRRHSWSRLLMWVGLLGILAGCFFFGKVIILYRFATWWWAIAAVFFAAIFGLSAAYFLRKSRQTK
jgi:hypothetical protein